MTITVSIAPTQSQIFQALGGFIQSVFAGYEVITAQINRVPEPQGNNFVVMTPLSMPRLSTNLDSYVDVQFEGAISGTTLTVDSVAYGTIVPGSVLYGTGVAANTIIQSQLTGPAGGAGTYQVSASQTITPAQVMASGTQTVEKDSEAIIQLDFHSLDLTSSDVANTIAALFRDEIAVDYFAALGAPLNSISPLHGDDPRQAPFENDQAQTEWRWTLDVHLQVNQVVSIGQQFATSADIDVVSVNAAYD